MATLYAIRNESHRAFSVLVRKRFADAGFQVVPLGSGHVPDVLRSLHGAREILFVRHLPDYLVHVPEGDLAWLCDLKTRQNRKYSNYAIELDSHEVMVGLARLGYRTFYALDGGHCAWAKDVEFFRVLGSSESCRTKGSGTAFGLVAPEAAFLVPFESFLERMRKNDYRADSH